MAFDERTKQYLPEEEIMRDKTDAPNASKARKAAVDKLTSAFVAKQEEAQEAKEEAQEAEQTAQDDIMANMVASVDKAIADIEANGYKEAYVRRDFYGNVVQGIETDNQQLRRVLQQRKNYLEGAISLAVNNSDRYEAMITQYKEVSKQLDRLEKAIKKDARKRY